MAFLFALRAIGLEGRDGRWQQMGVGIAFLRAGLAAIAAPPTRG